MISGLSPRLGAVSPKMVESGSCPLGNSQFPYNQFIGKCMKLKIPAKFVLIVGKGHFWQQLGVGCSVQYAQAAVCPGVLPTRPGGDQHLLGSHYIPCPGQGAVHLSFPIILSVNLGIVALLCR